VTAVAKKGLTLLVVAFAAFYLLSKPQGAADAIQVAGEALQTAFEQVMRFFSALFD
jgi:hypothetical protein